MNSKSMTFLAILAVLSSLAISTNVPSQNKEAPALSFDLGSESDLLDKDYTKSQELDRVLQQRLDAEVNSLNRTWNQTMDQKTDQTVGVTMDQPMDQESNKTKIKDTEAQDDSLSIEDEEEINDLSELESSALVSGDVKKAQTKEVNPLEKPKNPSGSKPKIGSESKSSAKAKAKTTQPVGTNTAKKQKPQKRTDTKIKNPNIEVNDVPEYPSMVNKGIQAEYNDKKTNPSNRKIRNGDFDSEDKELAINSWEDSDQQDDKDVDDMGREETAARSVKPNEDSEDDDTLALDKELQFMTGREYMVEQSQTEYAAATQSQPTADVSGDRGFVIWTLVGLLVALIITIIGMALYLKFKQETIGQQRLVLY